MQVKIGTDILDKNRFLSSCEKGGDSFLTKIFTPHEIRVNNKDQLASIFCLKEAVVKALELQSSSWLSISTSRKGNGKVICSFTDVKIAKKIKSIDTSISHEDNMIVAVAVVIVQNN